MPKISLIIPLYNAQKYLTQCLESVKVQTFQDFECLCIDDGSSDATVEIVQAIAAEDSRFILVQQSNQGCSAARNTGMALSKAPYLAFLDQDDLYHPQALEVLYFLIEKHSADIAGFRFKEVPEDFAITSTQLETYALENLQSEEVDDALEHFFAKKGLVQIWIRVYRKEALEGLEFPVGIQPCEDNIFSLKAFHRARKVVFIQEELYFYRESSTSVMQKGITENYIKANLNAAIDMHNYFVREERVSGQLLANIQHYIARAFIFKPCVSYLLRKTSGTNLQAKLLKSYTPIVSELYTSGIFVIESLRWNQRMASYLFCRQHYRLAKYFAML